MVSGVSRCVVDENTTDGSGTVVKAALEVDMHAGGTDKIMCRCFQQRWDVFVSPSLASPLSLPISSIISGRIGISASIRIGININIYTDLHGKCSATTTSNHATATTSTSSTTTAATTTPAPESDPQAPKPISPYARRPTELSKLMTSSALVLCCPSSQAFKYCSSHTRDCLFCVHFGDKVSQRYTLCAHLAQTSRFQDIIFQATP
jgi:hypothetical protein